MAYMNGAYIKNGTIDKSDQFITDTYLFARDANQPWKWRIFHVGHQLIDRNNEQQCIQRVFLVQKDFVSWIISKYIPIRVDKDAHTSRSEKEHVVQGRYCYIYKRKRHNIRHRNTLEFDRKRRVTGHDCHWS
ncbi:hypothetical protein [Escherichia coli]|uniref:hypothetical protein n=1 Tax=Escherichia coli TaxID=562 RepID=UPI00403CF6B1